MKITKEQLKQIIKEELSVVLNENDLIKSNGQNFLLSPRFIRGDSYMPGQPDHYAEVVKQALRGDLDKQRGLDAAVDLYPMVQNGHPLITKNERAKNQLMDFLDYAIKKLQ